ncbi:MAG: ADP-ribosylglycohydrolase family protein [Candidatus Helarchaeota archaeon]
MQIDYKLFLGSLLGEAIGDVLGAPIEGFKKNTLKPYFSTLKIPYTFLDTQRICYNSKGFYRDILGLHTDDTQYMLVLLDSIYRDKKGEFVYDLSKSIELFKNLVSVKIPGSKSGALRGTGKNARTSFFRIFKNKPLFELGTDSAGIGSAMRIGPPSLLFMNNKKKLQEFVIKSSIITHLNVAGIAAAYTQALLTTKCYKLNSHICNKTLSKQVIIDSANEIINNVFNFEEELKTLLTKIFPNTKIEINSSSQYLHLISNALNYCKKLLEADVNDNDAIPNLLNYLGVNYPSGFAPVGMAVTFYQVLSNILNPVKCLCSTMKLGGDTDTIGAMVGAAIFAAHGVSTIPEIWKKKLIIYNELVKRADLLIIQKDTKPTDLIKLEIEWTKKSKRIIK